MLMNYKFKNYKSYYNECNFSMLANSDKSHSSNLEEIGKDKISKVKIIYGANASGKSSFIQSVEFVKMFALMSNRLVEGNHIAVNPYMFVNDYANNPSEFNITFLKNETKYNYSFSCTSEKVINEKVDVYYTSKPTNIFTRTNTNDYKFNTDIKVLNEIKSKNTINKLFLITAATWNYEKVKPVVDYIMNDIVVLYDTAQPTKYNMDYIIKNNDFDEYKKFCLDFLNNADLSINDFEVNSKKLKELPAELMRNIVNMITNNDPEQINKISNTDVYNIKTHHKISHNGTENLYTLELIEESIGTQQLFHLAPILFYVFKEGKTLFIDEIDRSLHPILVEHIIRKFFNKEINTKNSQLICNTHDTNLLNLELFRRDEIWFAERDNITGFSTMFSLSDFSPRKDENIEKAYLLGRFGAIPFIKGD